MKIMSYCTRELYKRVGVHNLTAYSAQMAYFFLLSIFPFLIILFAVLGKLQLTYDVFSTAYMQLVPYEAYEIIDGYIKQLLEIKLETVLPISLIASLITASKALNALERALNQAYEVAYPRKYFYGRLLSVVMTIMMIVILLIALTLPSMGTNFYLFLENHFDLGIWGQLFFEYGRWIVMVGAFMSVLTIIYTVLPNRKVKLKDAIPGVLFTMSGLLLLSAGFSLFIRSFSNISFVYGSLGAVITLMLWLYFVGMLLMLGAELNAILLKWHENKRCTENS